MSDKQKPWHNKHRRSHKPKLKKGERHKLHRLKLINEEPPPPVIDEEPNPR